MAKYTTAGSTFTDLVLEIFQNNGLLLAAGDRLAAPSGLTSARWQVLGVVDHEPAPVANVARSIGLTRQSVQQTADALEAEGFIEYEENPHHRRAKLMRLTPKGRERLREVEARQLAWANKLGGKLTAASLKTVVGTLREVREALEQDASTNA
ncbi:MarR family winged helix-turn-helix transcriptional regulator [Myxococcus sp. MISCRS1]|jgi:DNA-binding MarR family transcriptional regulator|uniref:MarR family winged helix-turn-helix transcriptional regulator n=1 Tax=Myxococcus TaxID=32 RepID=UPI001CBB31C8|nr:MULTISPECIES: MarR family winged helix-turn-helix transcriptional regulator [unclassified Myxococcus]MBZ4408813.1 MarR family winged helix-turn-helix transcriptional regulator [Myxococcus sp. XM-1-1-1]MCY1000876.1 MarR family winged helix-turn-helix transcriptional regulator [Myxococcus sp. MISCRS1]BDT37580.1 MarR family winged helix-turn-helix transcriptional regulator [Myxococcus sp. MH1]